MAEKELKVEGKYNPIKIHTYNWGNFIMLTDYRNSKPHNFDIFIEIKGRYDKWFHIYKDGENSPVVSARGSFSGKSNSISGKNFRGRAQKKSEVLSRDKNLLGKVYVRFKNAKIVRQYREYEEFWGDVTGAS